MGEPLRLVVHRNKTAFDDLVVTQFFAINYERFGEKQTQSCSASHKDYDVERTIMPIRFNKKGCNAYLVSAYTVSLRKSDAYRRIAARKLSQIASSRVENGRKVIFVKLRTPKKQFLDYKWNERIIYMVLERQEADHALSWLSTLGGAFSALGEQFYDCAKIAGKISVKQFQLALRLGNPLLVARCKLYAALSLIQRGHLRTPKNIVKTIYRFSVQENDVRLQNMCHGVWAKLKYSYELRKRRALQKN